MGRPPHDSVESPRAWLTKVAMHASIDGLRARQARRERYPSEWLPEPVSVTPGPEDVVTDRSALSVGVLAMMESLSPLERGVFVLYPAQAQAASSTIGHDSNCASDPSGFSLTPSGCRQRRSASWQPVWAAASRH